MERATRAIGSTHEPETPADADVIGRWAAHLSGQARTLRKTFPGGMFLVGRVGQVQAPYAMVQGTSVRLKVNKCLERLPALMKEAFHHSTRLHRQFPLASLSILFLAPLSRITMRKLSPSMPVRPRSMSKFLVVTTSNASPPATIRRWRSINRSKAVHDVSGNSEGD